MELNNMLDGPDRLKLPITHPQFSSRKSEAT
jgi:hypothetical protein